jgi:hypothetical protein
MFALPIPRGSAGLEAEMKRTWLSLYYLMSYLLLGGVGLIAAPRLAMKMLGSNADYGEVLPRLTGMLMIGLAIIVASVIRLRLEAMYPVTLLVRGFFLPSLVALYLYSGDPFFLAIGGIVGLGMVLTGLSYWSEHGRRGDAGGVD